VSRKVQRIGASVIKALAVIACDIYRQFKDITRKSSPNHSYRNSTLRSNGVALLMTFIFNA